MADEKRYGHADKNHTEPVDIEVELPLSSGTTSQDTSKFPDKPVKIPDIEEINTKFGKEYEYIYAGGLVEHVKIIPWHSSYDYYKNFKEQAVKYSGYVIKPNYKPENVPFFSYMPQYSQLDKKQFEFYIWLRCEVKVGRFPEADFSYVQLLIYEAINLSDKANPEDILNYLISIWCGYRDTYSRLDTQLADWICDFCLINRLKFPIERISHFVRETVRISGFKEYWFVKSDDGDYLTDVIINYCSNYDYTKSKFAAGENLPLYKKHMYGAIAYVLGNCDYSNPELVNMLRIEKKKVLRDAYVGAVCVPSVRKRIEVEYNSIIHSYEFRFLVSDLLKYTENRLRSYLGIKSRISVGNIPDELRKKADEYFEKEGFVKQTSKKADVPEYEKFYDVANTGISPINARNIENDSWNITDALIGDFIEDTGVKYDDKSVSQPISESIPADIPAESLCEPSEGLSEAFSADMLEFIRGCLDGDADRQKSAAAALHKLPDMLASEINSLASDCFGDIILEKNGRIYSVISDYLEDVGNMLK